MKLSAKFISVILVLSVISGVLLSKASLVGKAGMTLFYRQYNFLKSWWKGALLVFIVLMILYVIQGLLQRDKPPKQKRIINIIAIALAVAGLYFTYLDFSETLSHRLLGTAFHIGAYLFWIGWLLISVCYFRGIRKPEDIVSH